MNIRLMKFLDELLGPPLCFILTIYNMARKIFIKPKSSPINKILLIKFLGMGSIIMTAPMVRALRKRFPAVKIAILTFANNKNICEAIDLFDEVIVVNADSIWLTTLDFIKKILFFRKQRFDAAIDLEFFSKSSTIICYLTGARNRVGFFLLRTGFFFKMMWRGDLLTHQVYYNPHRHTTEVFLALARSLGADTADMALAQIAIPHESEYYVAGLLQKAGIRQGDFLIAMNINAGQLCLERRWPAEKFAELTEKLLSNNNVKIVLIGDAEDVPYVNMFVKMAEWPKGLINLAGKLDIGALAVLLKKAKLLITNDSGPLHVAVCLGVATVSFFGPEVPERYGPLGKGHTIFYSGVYCSPCLNVYNQKTAPCDGKNICMQKIDVQDVYNTIKKRYLE